MERVILFNGRYKCIFIIIIIINLQLHNYNQKVNGDPILIRSNFVHKQLNSVYLTRMRSKFFITVALGFPEIWHGKGKENERKSIYIRLYSLQRLVTMRSDMDHTVLPANYTMPAFPSYRSTGRHLSYHGLSYATENIEILRCLKRSIVSWS